MPHTTLLEDVRQKQDFFDQFCNAWRSEYRQRGGIIYCGRGCRGCCSLVVNCTALEAVAVARNLTPAQTARLSAQIPLIQECAAQASSLKEWLSAYRDQVGPCPFLEQDGSCGVYQVRPLSCRSLLATKEPHWCTTDFSSLSADQKQGFMESLDRSVVAFPTHYAATPQEIGQELELALLRSSEARYDCSLLGNLTWLVWLAREQKLEELLLAGPDAVRQRLSSHGLLSPYLVIIND